MKIAIVIPTVRNLNFLEEWNDEFKSCIGIIVEDHSYKKIATPYKYFNKVYHFAWEDIDRELQDKSWIICRKNAGIRNFGFLKAFQLGVDVTITLDDDCYPVKKNNFLKTHIENLSFLAPSDWYPTYPHRKYFATRGFPYLIRNKKEVVISHGLWSKILDFDAQTHLKYPDLKVSVLNQNLMEFIPKGYFFPMCSMNLAFKTKITPIMYFPPMGYDHKGNYWGFDRFDDIWAGIFAKKIIDHLDYAVVNGTPFVEHRKASDIKENLKKEKEGIKANEILFHEVKKVKLTKKTIIDAYKQLFDKVNIENLPNKDYFLKLKKAVNIWLGLFI